MYTYTYTTNTHDPYTTLPQHYLQHGVHSFQFVHHPRSLTAILHPHLPSLPPHLTPVLRHLLTRAGSRSRKRHRGRVRRAHPHRPAAFAAIGCAPKPHIAQHPPCRVWVQGHHHIIQTESHQIQGRPVRLCVCTRARIRSPAAPPRPSALPCLALSCPPGSGRLSLLPPSRGRGRGIARAGVRPESAVAL